MDKSKIYISVEGVNLPNKPLTNFQLIDTLGLASRTKI